MVPEVAALLVAIMAARLTSNEAPVITSFFFFWAYAAGDPEMDLRSRGRRSCVGKEPATNWMNNLRWVAITNNEAGDEIVASLILS